MASSIWPKSASVGGLSPRSRRSKSKTQRNKKSNREAWGSQQDNSASWEYSFQTAPKYKASCNDKDKLYLRFLESNNKTSTYRVPFIAERSEVKSLCENNKNELEDRPKRPINRPFSAEERISMSQKERGKCGTITIKRTETVVKCAPNASCSSESVKSGNKHTYVLYGNDQQDETHCNGLTGGETNEEGISVNYDEWEYNNVSDDDSHCDSSISSISGPIGSTDNVRDGSASQASGLSKRRVLARQRATRLALQRSNPNEFGYFKGAKMENKMMTRFSKAPNRTCLHLSTTDLTISEKINSGIQRKPNVPELRPPGSHKSHSNIQCSGHQSTDRNNLFRNNTHSSALSSTKINRSDSLDSFGVSSLLNASAAIQTSERKHKYSRASTPVNGYHQTLAHSASFIHPGDISSRAPPPTPRPSTTPHCTSYGLHSSSLSEFKLEDTQVVKPILKHEPSRQGSGKRVQFMVPEPQKATISVHIPHQYVKLV